MNTWPKRNTLEFAAFCLVVIGYLGWAIPKSVYTRGMDENLAGKHLLWIGILVGGWLLETFRAAAVMRWKERQHRTFREVKPVNLTEPLVVFCETCPIRPFGDAGTAMALGSLEATCSGCTQKHKP